MANFKQMVFVEAVKLKPRMELYSKDLTSWFKELAVIAAANSVCVAGFAMIACMRLESL